MPRPRGAPVLVVVLGLLAVLGCGGGEPEPRQDPTISFALLSEPANFNPNSSEGGAATTLYVTNGVFPSVFEVEPDLSVELNVDLLDRAEQVSMDPQTIVYEIKDAARWSDGEPITVDDFVFLWQASRGTDERFDPASTTGYDRIASIEGDDDGKTVRVVFAEPFADWRSLFTPALLPSHVLERGDAPELFNTGSPDLLRVSGGPFVLDSYQPGGQVVLRRNDAYYGPRAGLDRVTFPFSTPEAVVDALENDEVQVIYPAPSADLVERVRGIGDDRVVTESNLGLRFEHLDLNTADENLSDPALRRAILTAVDRQAIISRTIALFTEDADALNNRMFVPGQEGYQDNVTPFGLGAGRVDDARRILTDAGYRIEGDRLLGRDGQPIPPLRLVYLQATDDRRVTAEVIQQQLQPLGLSIEVQPVDNPTFGQRVAAEHDFDLVLFAWSASPFPFTISQQLYETGGPRNFGEYSNPVVDAAMARAADAVDPAIARDALNEADQQISQDAYTLPLFQAPTFLAHATGYENIEDNPTDVGPTWNVGDWRLAG